MMIKALLGLDVGTTSTKAVLFDLNGNEITRASSDPYHNQSPKPGWVEQNPEEIWQAVLTTIREVVGKSDSAQIIAMSMSVQSGSLIPGDKEGNPVYPMITWLDGRTAHMVMDWKQAGLESKVKQISGWSLYPGLCLPTIAWLRDNLPDVYKKTSHYYSVNDFLAKRLTGELVSNPSNASGMQLVDIQTANWSDELAELVGITTDMLSDIQASGTVIGEIRAEVCNVTGLNEGVLLVNGGHDQVCTALGLGINDPGKYLLACGTAWVFTGILKVPNWQNLPASLDLNFHAYPQRWTLSQSLGGLGASLEWWLRQAWAGIEGHINRREMFSSLSDELISTTVNQELFFLPITGGHADPATTRRGSFVGLEFNHTRAMMARAIMESAGYELRWALEAVKMADQPVEQLWMVGGAAQSPYWPSILANITDLPIQVPDYDYWPALGAAVLAGTGSGVFQNLGSAVDLFKKPSIEILPDQKIQEKYDQGFTKYKEMIRLLH